MYTYISHIDNTTRFLYVVLGLCIIILAHRLSITANTIIGVLVAVLVAYYLNEKDLSLGSNYLNAMHQILADPLFKNSRYLYRDSEIVIFLDKYRHFNNYNRPQFSKMVKHIDNFLRIGKELDTTPVPENFNLDFETMQSERLKIMNAYHSFIYRLPHTPASIEQYQKGMQRLEGLLDSNLKYARRSIIKYNKEKGIYISSRFPYKGHPAGVDRAATGYDYF